MKESSLNLCCLFLLFLTGSCSVPPIDSASIEPNAVRTNTNRTVEKIVTAKQSDVCAEPEIEQAITLYRDIKWMQETWKQFTADEHYCLPNAQHFNIPETAAFNDSMKRTIEAMVRQPYSYGSFTRDFLDQDFIAIVIDKTIPPPNNFSIVIFPEPKDGKTIPKPYWLFRNQDLSRTTVSGASNMTVIGTFTEDGKSKGCFVNWDEKQKQPSCDAKYKSPKAEWKSS